MLTLVHKLVINNLTDRRAQRKRDNHPDERDAARDLEVTTEETEVDFEADDEEEEDEAEVCDEVDERDGGGREDGFGEAGDATCEWNELLWLKQERGGSGRGICSSRSQVKRGKETHRRRKDR